MLAAERRHGAPQGREGAGWAHALRDGALLAMETTPLPTRVLDAAARLARQPARALRQTVSTRLVGTALQDACGALGAAIDDRDLLAAALAAPLQSALGVLEVEQALLRLEIVDAQTCPKLHVDRLRWRICSALFGAGTEYLPPGERPAVTESQAVLRLPTGVLAGMAGSLSGPGLWHRSPHACASHRRLFLSLDVG